MPFAAGTFTLVAGNPVVTGTIISSTWANNSLSDIATGLSTAVLKDGTQTTTATIPLALGASIPTGQTLSGAGSLSMTGPMSGAKIAKRLTADVTVSVTVLATVTAFSFSIAANEEWQAEYFLSPFLGTNSPGTRVTIVTPAAATQNITAIGCGNAGYAAPSITSISGTALSITGAGGANADTTGNTSLWVLNGANAGTVDFQISVVTATTTGLTLRKGSHMYATKLA